MVGNCIRFIPLKVTLATNPDTSPITPPPRANIASFLEILFFKRKVDILLIVLISFIFSPGLIVRVLTKNFFGIICWIFFKCNFFILVSVIINIFLASLIVENILFLDFLRIFLPMITSYGLFLKDTLIE